MANTKHISVELLQYFKGKQDALNADTYVKKNGTDRLMTADEGTKLAGIEAGAQVNIIESVALDDTASTISIADKKVTIGMSSYAKKSDITAAVHYKGTVANYSDLPTEGQAVGDMYNITNADATHGINAGDNVVWNGTAWDVLGGVIDLSGKVDKEEGKGLSTNDFTDALKTKLDGVAEGAQVNVIETVKVDGTALTVTDKAVDIDLSGKVDKETGKSLVSDTEITKLAGVSANANKTEVSAVSFTAGTKVGSITIDGGTATDFYAPTVAVTAEKTAGTKIATVTINGVGTDIYTEVEDWAAESDIDNMFKTE